MRCIEGNEADARPPHVPSLFLSQPSPSPCQRGAERESLGRPSPNDEDIESQIETINLFKRKYVIIDGLSRRLELDDLLVLLLRSRRNYCKWRNQRNRNAPVQIESTSGMIDRDGRGTTTRGQNLTAFLLLLAFSRRDNGLLS